MTSTGAALSYRRLRTPRSHGEVLVDPPLAAASALIEQNQTIVQAAQYDCQGQSLERLTAEARSHLKREARNFTAAYRDVEAELPQSDEAPILLAGHQPQLFHAGVWFKTFVLSALGKQCRGQAINLQIDNDDLRAASIRSPGGSAIEPHLESVMLDRSSGDMPYEERDVIDPELFSSFGRRVRRTISTLISDPLINRLWPLVTEALQQSNNLGICIAQARHRLEGQWGLQTLELPMSQVCQAVPFHWFTAHLLAQLPRFHKIYNSSLTEYRRVNRIRSNAHPVPDLATDNDWLEAPFWLWSQDHPRRRRMFARSLGDRIELTDRGAVNIALPLSADREATNAVHRLGQLTQQGVKLRPRALMTTMYARLFLGDLFLHGIGGAKYDQLTDLIIHRFFGLQPPAFYTITATTTLPIRRKQPESADLSRLTHTLRDLQYNPQRHLDSKAMNPESTRLAAEKQQWIDNFPSGGDLRQRHREITRINNQLQNHVAQKRKALNQQRTELELALRHEEILASREFSFCLFPEKTLRPLLLALSSDTP